MTVHTGTRAVPGDRDSVAVTSSGSADSSSARWSSGSSSASSWIVRPAPIRSSPLVGIFLGIVAGGVGFAVRVRGALRG